MTQEISSWVAEKVPLICGSTTLASVIVMPNRRVESWTVRRISHCRPLMLKRLSAGAGSDRRSAEEGRPESANDKTLHAYGAPSQPLCCIFRRRAILTRDRRPDHRGGTNGPYRSKNVRDAASNARTAPHPGPLPAGGERESTALSTAFPRPACGERDRVRGGCRRLSRGRIWRGNAAGPAHPSSK